MGLLYALWKIHGPRPVTPAFQRNVKWDSRAYITFWCQNWQTWSSQAGSLFAFPMTIIDCFVQALLLHYLPSFKLSNLPITIFVFFTAPRVFKFLTSFRIFFFKPTIASSVAAPQIIDSSLTLERPEHLEPYVHMPLRNESCLRLLLLKSGKYEDELECELHEFAVDTAAQYDTLSYEWGNRNPERYIRCMGKEITITQNCETGLRQLRSSIRGRLLWVDAICINQKDNIEKSHQLRVMDHIYSRSQKVVVWLGPGTPESDTALRYVRFISQFASLPTWLFNWIFGIIGELIIQRGHQEFVCNLAKIGWFTRVWTLQEATVARPSHIVLVCGEFEASFDDIYYTMWDTILKLSSSHDYHLNQCRSEALYLRYIMRRGIIYGDKLPEWERSAGTWLMRFITTCQATDGRDVVFSLYAIFQRLGISIIEPHCDLSIGQVYRTTAADIMGYEKSLALLTLVTGLEARYYETGDIREPEDASTVHRYKDCPSWVPDFGHGYRSRLVLSDKFHATMTSRSDFSFMQRHPKIVTRATIFDTVQEASSLCPWKTETTPSSNSPTETTRFAAATNDSVTMNLKFHYRETVQAFQEWFSMAFKPRPDSPYSNVEEAFYETLLFGNKNWSLEPLCEWMMHMMSTHSYHDTMGTNGNWEQDEKMIFARDNPELQRDFFNNPSCQDMIQDPYWRVLCAAKTYPRIANVHHHIWMMSIDCLFFVTKSGYIGTAPRSIRKGDVVALIPGVNMPMILRHKNSHSNAYEVLASAYIHGIMEGEIWGQAKEYLKDIILE